MPTIVHEPPRQTDWLKREADSLYSRAEIVIAASQGDLPSGAVLGRITSAGATQGQYKLVTVAANDGSQNAAAVLLDPVANSAAAQPAVAIVRDAIVSNQGLAYGADVDTAPERAAVAAALAALNPPILVREGA